MKRKVHVVTRREVLRYGMGVFPFLMAISGSASRAGKAGSRDKDSKALVQKIAALERRHGGTLGVALYDTATGLLVSHRGYDRFPMCSTHKFITVALTLWRVDRGEESLDQRVVYSAHDLTDYAPFTRQHVGAPGVTVGELCAAALTLSDNTAANLLLRRVGGPQAWTHWVRTLGDARSRLDHYEPKVNDVVRGDLCDTTTPIAMLRDMQKVVLGNVLSTSSRQQLTAWMLACQTGGNRLRAGLPKSWREADKTGTGPAMNHATNDIAVLWPPHRAPILVTAYYAYSRESEDQRDGVLASVGRLVADSV